jgi:hypothetical protein
MIQFSLNRKKPSTVFSLNSPESYLHIRKITVVSNSIATQSITTAISSLQISYELQHTVYNEEKNQYVDDRIKSSAIHIDVDPNQTQPVFEMNLKIQNEKLQLGKNEESKWFSNLKIEFRNSNAMQEEIQLLFDVEFHDIQPID